MVQDLHIPVEIVVAPIVREDDGLALSSRNRYLTEKERAAAPKIRRALLALAEKIAAGTDDAASLAAGFTETLAADPIFEPEYIEIVDASTMRPLEKISAGNTLVAVAVRMSDSRTRLIDNIRV